MKQGQLSKSDTDLEELGHVLVEGLSRLSPVFDDIRVCVGVDADRLTSVPGDHRLHRSTTPGGLNRVQLNHLAIWCVHYKKKVKGHQLTVIREYTITHCSGFITYMNVFYQFKENTKIREHYETSQ